jgi:hypothetical protein
MRGHADVSKKLLAYNVTAAAYHTTTTLQRGNYRIRADSKLSLVVQVGAREGMGVCIHMCAVVWVGFHSTPLVVDKKRSQ